MNVVIISNFVTKVFQFSWSSTLFLKTKSESVTLSRHTFLEQAVLKHKLC